MNWLLAWVTCKLFTRPLISCILFLFFIAFLLWYLLCSYLCFYILITCCSCLFYRLSSVSWCLLITLFGSQTTVLPPVDHSLSYHRWFGFVWSSLEFWRQRWALRTRNYWFPSVLSRISLYIIFRDNLYLPWSCETLVLLFWIRCSNKGWRKVLGWFL